LILRNILFFCAISRNAFLNLAVFRVNFFGGLVTDVLLLGFSLLLWQALYASGLESPDHAFVQVVTYLLLARVAVSIDMDFVESLQNRVLRGEIVSELLKPLDLSNFLLAQESGNYLTRIVFRGLPIFVVVVALFDIPIPSLPYLCMFIASLILSFVLMFYINFITGIAAFWIIHLFSLNVLKTQLVRFLSGAYVPLWFFPPGLQGVLAYLPFASIVYVPVHIYLEKETLAVSFFFLLLQCIWIVVMLLLSRWVWRRATTQLVINGG